MLYAMYAQFRPLPATPDLAVGQEHFNNYYNYVPKSSADIYAASAPYLPPAPYPQYTTQSPPIREEEPAPLPGGTVLHKGFYDLLALTASRFLWGQPQQKNEDLVAGPKYEAMSSQSPPRARPGPLATPVSPNVSPRKGRRLSKDMVSKPMNFV